MIFGGNLLSGGTYNLTWANSRIDSQIPGYTLFNPRWTSSLTVGGTQPLLRNFGKTVTNRLVVQAQYGRDTSAWSFVSRFNLPSRASTAPIGISLTPVRSSRRVRKPLPSPKT